MSAILLMLAALVAAPVGDEADLTWFDGGYNSAIKQARSESKLIFIAFVPEWSEYSQKVANETLPDPAVAAELGDLICLKYAADDREANQVAKIYNIDTFPSFVVAEPDGKIEDLITGFIPADPMVGQMQRIKARDNTVSFWREQMEAEPEDLGLVYQYADKLRNVNDTRRADKAIRQIRAADPEGETLVGARLIMDQVWVDADPEQDGTVDLDYVVSHIDGLKMDGARFEAWNKIGNFHAGQGDMDASRDAFMQAYEVIPESYVLGWGFDVANFFAEGAEGGISPEHSRFAIEVAERSVTVAETLSDPELAASKGFEFDNYDAWLAERLDTLAWIHFRLGDQADPARIERALTLAERCVALDPENPEYQGRVAMYKARM